MIAFLSIIAVGFFLGMRHATDPDHVIAVATIVSRQRSLTRAALIGAFWGLGHTVTILVVGAGIILFNLVIPVRVGLSMELSVGFMLIILGIINVASFLRAIPEVPIASPDELQGNAAHHSGAVHTHSHSHGDYVHSHRHAHGPEVHPHGPDQTRWRFWIGCLPDSAYISTCDRWQWVSFTDWRARRRWPCLFLPPSAIRIWLLPICWSLESAPSQA